MVSEKDRFEELSDCFLNHTFPNTSGIHENITEMLTIYRALQKEFGKQIQESIKDADALRARIEKLTEINLMLETDNGDLSVKVEKLEEDLRNVKEQRVFYQKENQEFKEIIDEHISERVQLTKENSELHVKTDFLETEKEAFRKEIQELKQQYNEILKENEEIENLDSDEKLKAKFIKLQKENQELKQQLEKLEKELDLAITEENRMNKLILGYSKLIEQISGRLFKKKEKIRKLRKENEQLKADLKAAKEWY